MKSSNDTIENRTRDFRACSVVLQQTAPPRIPPREEYMCVKSKFADTANFVPGFTVEIFFLGVTTTSGSGRPRYRGFTITITTHHTR